MPEEEPASVSEDEATSEETTAGTEPEAEAAPEAEAEAEPEAEAEAEAEPEPEPEAAEAEERESDPAVQDVINQDTTVVHHAEEGEHGVPTTFRTPPGVPGGLDPKTLADRDVGPRPPDPDD